MKIKNGFEMRDICGEKLVIAEGLNNINFTTVLHLNETASFLWTKMKEIENFNLKKLTQELINEFDVNPKTAQNDVTFFIHELLKLKIIEN